jgi:hypothetical protein
VFFKLSRSTLVLHDEMKMIGSKIHFKETKHLWLQGYVVAHGTVLVVEIM